MDTSLRGSVLLTVPHASCPRDHKHGHPCDTLAKHAARRVFDCARSDSGIERPLVSKDVPRAVCDLNRIQCRDHPWREKIRQRLRAGGVAFVLDVHSYPPTTPKGWAPFDLVLLDDAPAPRTYTLDFARYMDAAGIRVAVFRGKGNDIQDEARELGVRSMLLEFNEGIGRDTDRFGVIACHVASWFSTGWHIGTDEPFNVQYSTGIRKDMTRRPVLTAGECLHEPPEETLRVLKGGVLYGRVGEGTPDASDVIIDLRETEGSFLPQQRSLDATSDTTVQIGLLPWWWWSPWWWWWWTPRWPRRGREHGRRGRGRGRGRGPRRDGIRMKMDGCAEYETIDGEVRIGLREREDIAPPAFTSISCNDGSAHERFELGLIEISTGSGSTPLRVTSVTIGPDEENRDNKKYDDIDGSSGGGGAEYVGGPAVRETIGRKWDPETDAARYQLTIATANTRTPSDLFNLFREWTDIQLTDAVVKILPQSEVADKWALTLERASINGNIYDVLISLEGADPQMAFGNRKLYSVITQTRIQSFEDVLSLHGETIFMGATLSMTAGTGDGQKALDLLEALAAAANEVYTHRIGANGWDLELRSTQAMVKPARTGFRGQEIIGRKWEPDVDVTSFPVKVATAEVHDLPSMIALLREWEHIPRGDVVIRELRGDNVFEYWSMVLLRPQKRPNYYNVRLEFHGTFIDDLGHSHLKKFYNFEIKEKENPLNSILSIYGSPSADDIWMQINYKAVGLYMKVGLGGGKKTLDLLDALSSISDDDLLLTYPDSPPWKFELRSKQSMIKPARTGVRVIPRILPKKKGVDWINVTVAPGIEGAVQVSVRGESRSTNPWYREGYREKYALTLVSPDKKSYISRQGLRLNMIYGNEYFFEVANVPAKHPFHFTTNETGGPSAPDNTRLSVPRHKDSMPPVLRYSPTKTGGSYYQCETHDKMGGPVFVSRATVTAPLFVDEESGKRVAQCCATHRFVVLDEDGKEVGGAPGTLEGAVAKLGLAITARFNISESIASVNPGVVLASISRNESDDFDGHSPAVLLKSDGTILCDHVHTLDELRAWLVEGKPEDSEQLCPECCV